MVSMDLMTAEFILGHLNYWLFIVLMMTGLYIVIAKGNLVKKNCWFEHLSGVCVYVVYLGG